MEKIGEHIIILTMGYPMSGTSAVISEGVRTRMGRVYRKVIKIVKCFEYFVGIICN